MRSIAIMNNKGGVGKTVTCINLADILIRDYGKRVVLVDCDGQMNLTRFYLPDFGRESAPTVRDVLVGSNEPVWSDNTQPLNASLSLLPGDSMLYSLDIAAFQGRRPNLHALEDFQLAAAEDGETDFFLYDCPPGFTTASCSALLAAEEVIIPMLVDGFSFAGMADMTAQILGLRKANSAIRLTGILVNQWHNSDVVRQGEALLRTLDVPVFRQTIRRTDKVPESTFDRSPLQIYSPGSAASRDFRAWVAELLEEEAGSNGKKV